MKFTLYQIVVIVSVIILLVPQNTFGIQQAYNPTLEYFFGNTTTTQLDHDGAQIIINQTVGKLEYKIGETINITPELINIGNKSVTIFYIPPLLSIEVKYQNGSIAWPTSLEGYVLEQPSHNETLRPNAPFTTEDTPNEKATHSIILNSSGKYNVISMAHFTFNDSGLAPYEVLWSKSLQITVLPEKYVQNETNSPMPKIPEFPFAIPMLLVGIASLILLYRIKFTTHI